MATLSQVKIYGGIGAILTLLLPVPSVGIFLAIAGFILTLIAVKYASDLLADKAIMNDMVLSIVMAIVGVVVGVTIVLGGVLNLMASAFPGLTFANISTYFGPGFNPATVPASTWLGFAGWVFVGLAVIWGTMLVSGVYFRRGFSEMGTKLHVGMFGTAGLIFLIGAATTIILVGFLLIPIALILLAVAFFSINDSTPIPATVQPRPATP
jgi:uncharacterized membrane protein